ncbi:MAG: DUF748 domain-containing protein [Desulfuromonadaceae bacterium]|nr:DUF748 domain-containing protein [Desulfuromonadaceae bacterium]
MSHPTPESAPASESSPAPSRWRPRLRKILRVGVYLVVALFLFLALLPMGLRMGVEYWLNKQPGIAAEIGNIDFNLFSATFALEELKIEYEGVPHTEVQRLTVAAKYLPLWDKHAFIDHVELRGVRLILEQLAPETAETSDALRIGGLLLPPSAAATSGPENATEAEAAPSVWGFGWDRVVIDDAKIVWRQPEWSADLIIEHAYLEDVASWKPNTDSKLHLELRLNDAPVGITAQTRPFANQRSINGHINIEAFALGKLAPIFAPAGVHDIAGIFRCNLEHKISITDAGEICLEWDGSLGLTHAELSTAQVHVAKAELQWEGEGNITTSPNSVTRINLESTLQIPALDMEALESGLALQQEGLHWSGTVATVLAHDSEPDIKVEGNFGTANLKVVDKAHSRLLTSWAGLEGSGFTFTRDQLQLGQLNIAELIALRPSTNPAETEPPLARCGTLALTALAVDLAQEDGGTAISLKELTLRDLEVELIRYASGHTNIEQWSTPAADASAETVTSDTPENAEALSVSTQAEDSATPPLRWSLDKLHIEGNSAVYFTDATTKPGVSLDLNALNLRVEHLNSNASQTRNPLHLDAKLGHFTTLKASGHVSVLAPKPEGEVELKLYGFQLYSIAPYVEKTLGARIERGELDFDAATTINNNILKLESQTVLRSFILGDMTAEQEERISSNLGLPLSLALALLRDNNGDIHLDIPVSGDLSRPDIAIAPVVRKALFGAVQETVKLALKPLGVISGAGKLFGIGRELELPPVLFIPMQMNLLDPATTLKPLRDLLTQRPQLRVVLRAPLTTADATALRPPAAEGENATDNSAEATEAARMSEREFRSAATLLLQHRLNAVKEWLLEDGEIHNNQVLLTQPLLAPVSGEPRVEIRF